MDDTTITTFGGHNLEEGDYIVITTGRKTFFLKCFAAIFGLINYWRFDRSLTSFINFKESGHRVTSVVSSTVMEL